MGIRVAKTQYNVTHYFWKLIDLIYPPTCAGCGKFGSRWCDACNAAVEGIKKPYCQSCHQPISNGNLCSTCQGSPPAFDKLRSWGIYSGPLRNAIHRLKYEKDISLGDVFSRDIAAAIIEIRWEFDLILPIPLSRQRKNERGYNQAEILARPIAFQLDKNYDSAILYRNKNTISQVGLSLAERLENVRHAFSADRSSVEGRSILLIDDVCTSGATINACAETLKMAGAKTVFGYTLARAIRI